MGTTSDYELKNTQKKMDEYIPSTIEKESKMQFSCCLTTYLSFENVKNVLKHR
jgi:hypothetical protein